jgi:aminocarboxymuconate-semialdehyde decarboxylase
MAAKEDDYGGFTALTSVPVAAPKAALTEAGRAIDHLGLKGFIVGSNIDGTPLNDDAFEPFYELVSELDVPLFIHPMEPAGVEVMGEYRLAPLVGFENEITMAITRLVFDGVLERHDIDIHLSHLGGTVPYLFERLNNGYRAYPECRQHIDQPPETYLKQVHYDTVSFHEPALYCALESVGADRLLVGSDYPHVIGDIERAVTDIEALELTARERERIKGRNVERLYGI